MESKENKFTEFEEKMQEFREKLQEYFRITPREKILEDWEKCKEFDQVGILGSTFCEYIENITDTSCEINE